MERKHVKIYVAIFKNQSENLAKLQKLMVVKHHLERAIRVQVLTFHQTTGTKATGSELICVKAHGVF